MNLKTIISLLKAAFAEWLDDKAMRLGAALAYYTVFSISPLLLIMISIAGLVFGKEAARGQVMSELQNLLGGDAAQAMEAMILNARRPATGILSAVVGVLVLLLGASGVFGQLQEALNTAWKVEPKRRRGIVGLIRDRFLSFTMVLGVGFLLLVSLVLTAWISAGTRYVGGFVPALAYVTETLYLLLSFCVITILFAMIYKFLPETEIEWRDVWVGAAITSLLFTVGKFAIGFYLGRSGIASAYGAAGSLVVLLVWVYYSAQIFLFGAELTQVYACRHGSRSAQSIPADSAPVPEALEEP